jgi:cation-transporting ATPase F
MGWLWDISKVDPPWGGFHPMDCESQLPQLILPMESPPPATWHAITAEEAARTLGVTVATGLSKAEVTRRQAESGPNKVSARRGTPAWLKFLQQFHQPLVYIMLVAVGVTSFLGEWVDAAVIGAIVLVNAIVGFLQETKAETAIEALAKMVVTEATVRREGKKERIPSESLVPGDVVLLQSGDRVPADMRLIEIRSLQVDESALTGESLPVAKQLDVLPEGTELADRTNLAFAGTFITSGQAEGVVCLIGDQTETGRIAGLIAGAVEMSTPLTKQIARFSQMVLWVILGLAALTFAVGVMRGEKPANMFMAAVALAVGAIPEGLPAAVTIVLAIGVSRMARRQAIIRKLPAVETLGSTTVICSDKTGTLTENQMTVREVFAGGKLFTVTGSGYEPKGELMLDGTAVKSEEHAALAECLRAGLLCNDSQIVLKEGHHAVQGDPTEAALIIAAEKMGLKHTATHRESPRVDMIPFESENMFRATLHEDEDERVIYQVGALERLLDRCTNVLGDDCQTTALDKAAVLRSADAMASHGLRVLAMVRRQVDKAHDNLEIEHVAKDLTFLGLQGMIDPPRAAAVASVANFAKAGIAVKMITGDHLITARAIATQIGLKGDEALTGNDLEKIADAELPEIAERTTVFARVAPEQKLRLVKALQARGHVVAMTGDGVNDAPALKQADIGVAMGISGTDVAKGAAAMILTDDNFASIEAAVEEGRGVYDNLTKFIVWIIPTNLGESLMLLCAIMLGLPLPLVPLQLLWINLTDTVLGLSLAFEPKEGDVMNRPPRPTHQPLLPWPLILRSGLVSSIMLAGGLGVFLWELRMENAGLASARTAVVNVIVLVQVFYLFNCRALKHTALSAGLFKNRWVIAGALTMLTAQVLFTHSAVLNQLFHSAPISAGAWLRVTAAAVVVFIVVEIEKWLRFRRA